MSHMPDGPDSLAALENQKAALLRKISQLGDFRPGPVRSRPPLGAVATPIAIATAPRMPGTDPIFG